MSKLHISAAPHINSGNSTSSVMRDVAIALLPATVAAVAMRTSFPLRSLPPLTRRFALTTTSIMEDF